MSGNNTSFGNIQGDVIGFNVAGTGNTFGKNITVKNVSLNSSQVANISNEYAKGLETFSEVVNQQLQLHNVPSEKIVPIQESINDLAQEVEDVKPDEKISYTKKTSIKAKLAALAEGVLSALPKAAEITAAFTPLAPFSKLVGEGVEEIVKAVQEG